jgi:hypothetical protein
MDMKKFSLLFAALFLLVLSSASYSKNYYVCDSTGNDDNDGLSESTAFKSYPKAISTFNKMFAGDSVLFCRGDVFPVTVDARIYNSMCGAEKPCTLGSYGDESLPKPVLNATNQNGLYFTEGGNADQDGGYIVRDLSILSDGNSKKNGIIIYNDVDDITLDGLHIEGFRIGVYSAGANTPNAMANGINDRLVLKNSVIINNSSQGFHGGCQDCLIENNTFENNGFGQKILDHNIYLGWSSSIAKGVTIRNNTLYKSTHIDGKCQGVSLVVHGKFEDLVIENNTVKEDLGKVTGYCWGISVDPGYAKEEAFYNVTIRKNTLINVGNVAIGCASCDGVSIDDNTIIDEGNVLTYGISVPAKAEDSVKSKNVVIRNNRIVYDNPNGYGVAVGGEQLSKILSNQVYQPHASTVECFRRTAANSNTDISTNECNTHNGLNLMNLMTNQQSIVADDLLEEEHAQDIDESDIQQEVIDTGNDGIKSETVTDLIQSQQSNPLRNSSTTTRASKTNSSNGETTTKTTSPNRSSVSSSSAGSSSSRSTSSRTSSADSSEIKGDSELTNRNSNQSTNPSLSTITESEALDISNDRVPELPKATEQTNRSSIKSVTVNEVIKAQQDNVEDIDPTTCRAYSRGVCLMR